MPSPSTIVTFVDQDGDEFPVRLPGIYRQRHKEDIEDALRIAAEEIRHGHFTPRGELASDRIEYLNEA